MTSYNNFFSIVIFIFYSMMSSGQTNKKYAYKLFINHLDTLQYRVMMPLNFDKSKSYPVLLFLHGAGERGRDNESQLIHGSKLFASDANRGRFPAIVVMPQCPKNSYWAKVKIDRSIKPLKIKFPKNSKPTKSMELVMKLMDNLVSKPYVNKNKIYVGGLSMGGMGTFEILYRKPKMFAAAIAICGAGNPETVKAYAKTTSLWVFHGAKDNVVNPQSSIDMVSSILKYGGKPNFTLYAKNSHNSWDTAFAEPKLLSWLFSNTKN